MVYGSQIAIGHESVNSLYYSIISHECNIWAYDQYSIVVCVGIALTTISIASALPVSLSL